MIQQYLNRNGNSSVKSYEIGPDFIKVWFNNMSWYVYNYMRPGKFHVEHMKELANQGQGLCSYIGKNKYVKYNYFRKGV